MDEQPAPNIQPEQLSPQPQEPLSKTWQIVAIIVAGILVVGGVSFGSYYLWQNATEKTSQNTSPSPSLSESVSPSATPDETAGWQTYKNEQYGFEVWYPKDWRTAQCGIDCQGFGPQGVGEDTMVGINILDSKLDTAKKSLPVLGNSNNRIIKEETVLINGARWVKLAIRQDVSGEIFTEHLIEKDGKTYDLGVGTDELNVVGVYNQILSTFKFTK